MTLNHAFGDGNLADWHLCWTQLDLILGAATVVVTFFSLVAGIFGMNIPYPWNHDHPESFAWVRLCLDS